MSVKTAAKLSLCMGLSTLVLSGCFNPPYNNFTPERRTLKQTLATTAVGAGAGALIGSVVGGTAAGAVIGGAAGVAIGLYAGNQHNLIKAIKKQDMQYFAYGDTMTLVVPTDRYFLYNSPHLNDICYPGLNNIVRLLKYYPNSPIYVAAFTDDVGTRHHKNKLSQAQAETMITFLWANNIPAQLLHPEGYGDKHDVADNHWIHGSAYNRRIEIQWLNGPFPTRSQPARA
ncbi:MAG: C-OmpA-like family protein CmpA [Legionellales bacterium]|nr:C-OmpA-like family protein CmpA [Legionellales bacterium]